MPASAAPFAGSHAFAERRSFVPKKRCGTSLAEVVLQAQPHPHSGAIYRLTAWPDDSFGVEVTIPDMPPTTVTGFASRAEADRWIAKHKEEVAVGNSLRHRSTVFRKI